MTFGQKPEGKLSITIEHEGLVAASHMLTLEIQVSSFWNSTCRIGTPQQSRPRGLSLAKGSILISNPQGTASSGMEVTNSDNSQSATCSSDVDHVAETVGHDAKSEQAEGKYDVSIEEIKNIMEVMAASGKFWHEWDMLKSLLSFWMKQVLAEYPEAQMASGGGLQKSSLVGETYAELAKRLDEALLSFTEGPPFTLQRLCEILLSPKSTYSNLSKLALALEKNLLVTSTLTMCTEPYPGELGQKHKPGMENEITKEKPVPNGVETPIGDGDEEMTDAEASESTDTADTEMQEEKVQEEV
ncbi:hypothetical protein OPV22_030088 [Ensete ventricosum]|uniref:Uncharacterized protein n=1 Tax=Ensete ventricosum TaxID=4639 RepID=A0AAV8P6R5_ENSVE|nr:hypothetical protein OPV22_030088 [Ensete ventricosum]